MLGYLVEAATFFRFGKDTQQIAAENLVNLRLIVATIEQFLCQIRIPRHILHLNRQPGNPIKIRTDADMVNARHLDYLINVVGNRVDGADGVVVLLTPSIHRNLELLIVVGVFLPQLSANGEHRLHRPRPFGHDEAGGRN